MDQQPNDSKYKLWQGLSDKKLYTKSYEDFNNQFNTDKAIGGLYDALSIRKLYTKSKEDFSNQFFAVKDTTAASPTKSTEKPTKEEEPYNFEKTFLYNIGASDWSGSAGSVMPTAIELLQGGGSFSLGESPSLLKSGGKAVTSKSATQKGEQVYNAPTGPIDIRTQEDLKRSEDAFDKFTEKRLRGKGIEFKKDDANYKKEKQLILNDIKNGDIFGYVEDGNLGFARSAGFLKGTINTIAGSIGKEFTAAKINTISDPRELADYANWHEQNDIEERAPEAAQIAGGLPKLIGTIALGTYAGGPTGGASLLAADAQWIGMSEKRLELYYNKRNQLIDSGMDKSEAEYSAASLAMQDAPLAAVPSAITNYVMASMGSAEGKSITPLSASRETFKKYLLQPNKIAALGFVQPLTEYGIERIQGYDVKFQDAINKSGKGYTDFFLMDLGMNVLTNPGKFAKSIVSSAKEYLANVDKNVLESMSSKYGTDGKSIISNLEGYNKARGKVAPYMPQELVHHVAGLQQAIDNKIATIKGLEADGNIPKTIIDTEQQKLDELKKRQDGIIQTGNTDEFEIDDKTGDPVVKEVKPPKENKDISFSKDYQGIKIIQDIISSDSDKEVLNEVEFLKTTEGQEFLNDLKEDYKGKGKEWPSISDKEAYEIDRKAKMVEDLMGAMAKQGVDLNMGDAFDMVDKIDEAYKKKAKEQERQGLERLSKEIFGEEEQTQETKSEAAPTKRVTTKIKLTEEQKQSNIDTATAEQRAEAINQTEQEYGSTTDKGVPTGETTGVSGDVSSEPAPKIESIKSATPEQRADFEQWKSRTYKSESDIDAEYESSKLREYGQSREEFLLGKYCK